MQISVTHTHTLILTASYQQSCLVLSQRKYQSLAHVRCCLHCLSAIDIPLLFARVHSSRQTQAYTRTHTHTQVRTMVNIQCCSGMQVLTPPYVVAQLCLCALLLDTSWQLSLPETEIICTATNPTNKLPFWVECNLLSRFFRQIQLWALFFCFWSKPFRLKYILFNFSGKYKILVCIFIFTVRSVEPLVFIRTTPMIWKL